MLGRQVIFNHHDPRTPEGRGYFARSVERFRQVISAKERKLFLVLNVERRGVLKEDELEKLFTVLCDMGVEAFELLVVKLLAPPKNSFHAKLPRLRRVRFEERGGHERPFRVMDVVELHCSGGVDAKHGVSLAEPEDQAMLLWLVLQGNGRVWNLKPDPIPAGRLERAKYGDNYLCKKVPTAITAAAQELERKYIYNG